MESDRPFTPNIEVLLRIARAFDDNASMKKTRLHLASRIRWNSFVRYLDWLIDNGYIRYELDESGEIYFLTDTGRMRLAKLSEFFDDGAYERFAAIVRHS